MEEQPLRIAEVTGIMNSGGVEAVVMNYYRAIDKTKVQFDFFVDETCSFPQREEIERLGGRYFLVPPYSQLIPYLSALIRLFRQNQYKIVHAHLNTISVFPLFAAWIARVPVRICHNHSTAHAGEGKKTALKYLLRPFAKVFATDYFACGETAGRWLYGNRCLEKGRIHVMPNAIDVGRYVFDEQSRRALREELKLGDATFALGHVGRFVYPKNHRFLIDIFRAFHERRTDSVLLLVGEGELQAEIQARAEAAGLKDCVRFLGVRGDVDRLYSAMDAFCLPSFYEGFPVVLVETQANGLPCVVSDVIAKESILQENVSCLSLSQPPEDWAACLDAAKRTERIDAVQAYDIAKCAKQLETFYLSRAD